MKRSTLSKQRRTQLLILGLVGPTLGVVLIFSGPIALWLTTWTFIQVLEALSQLGVLIAVVAFLLELPKRNERAKAEQQRLQFEYWQVIDAAAAANTTTSYARKIALENLAQAGVSLRNVDAPQAELRRINLTGVDLVGANLAGTDLTDAVLSQVDLSKARLCKAKLYGANLSGATLAGADLREALYSDRTIFPTDFDPGKAGAYLIAPGTVLPGVQLPEAILWSVNLQGANLAGANLQAARFHGAQLQGCNFAGANLQGAKFRNAELTDANLQGANLRQANFWEAVGLTVAQVKAAHHWDEATYSPEFATQLGLT